MAGGLAVGGVQTKCSRNHKMLICESTWKYIKLGNFPPRNRIICANWFSLFSCCLLLVLYGSLEVGFYGKAVYGDRFCVRNVDEPFFAPQLNEISHGKTLCCGFLLETWFVISTWLLWHFQTGLLWLFNCFTIFLLGKSEVNLSRSKP